jgi:hypothetical protein
MSPVLGAKGSMSVQGFGHTIRSGQNSWIAILELNPAPASQPQPTGIVISVDPITEKCSFISSVPLSYSTAYQGNQKFFSITEEGVVSDVNLTSAYQSSYNGINIFVADSSSPLTAAAGTTVSSTGLYRPALFSLSNGQPTNSYYPVYSGNAGNIISSNYANAHYINSSGTYYYGLPQGNTTHSTIGAITSSSVVFSKYLLTASSTDITILSVRYNSFDNFIYVIAANTNTPNQGIFLLKYSSLGVLQWQRLITVNVAVAGITFDPSGNVIVNYAPVSSSTNYLVTYNGSGTILSSVVYSGMAVLSGTNSFFIYPIPKQAGGGYLINSGQSSGNTILILSSSFVPLAYYQLSGAPVTGVLDSFFAGVNSISLDNYGSMYICFGAHWSAVAGTAPYITDTLILKTPIIGAGASYSILNNNATLTISNFTLPSFSAGSVTDSAGNLIETTDTTTLSSLSWTSVSDPRSLVLKRTVR